MPTDITLSDETERAIAAIEGGAERFIAALAGQIRDNFRDNVNVDTGATQASASVITSSNSDYSANVARAAALNPTASFAPEAQVAEGEAIVQVPIDYATFGEFGSSRRPAYPAFVPAVEAAAANAEKIAREVFDL